MAGWFESIGKQMGWKKSEFLDLTKEEKNKALQDMRLRQRKLEQKISFGEKEMNDLALELVKCSKFKAAMMVNKLKQKKSLMAARVKAYNINGLNLNALETSIELEDIMGNKIDKKTMKKMEALSPASLEAFLEYMKDEMNQQELTGEGIQMVMESFSASVDRNVDIDILELVGEVQDAVLDNENLSDEEKAKKIMEMI